MGLGPFNSQPHPDFQFQGKVPATPISDESYYSIPVLLRLPNNCDERESSGTPPRFPKLWINLRDDRSCAGRHLMSLPGGPEIALRERP